MSKTLQEVRDDVRDILNESAAREWENDMLNRWINDGCRDIARRAECLLDRADVTAVAGTGEYATADGVPTNIVRISSVEWRPTGSTSRYPLEYHDFRGMDDIWWVNQTSQGTPSVFTTWGYPPNLKLVVYPTPSGAGTFKIFYYRLPATVGSDTADIDVPNGWEDAVVEYAVFKGLRRDADPRWQEAKTLYEEHVAHLTDVTQRYVDQAGSIVMGGTHLPAWIWAGEDY